MSETADMAPTPPAPPICAACKWALDEAGLQFQNGNRAFCSNPSVITDTDAPVPCELQRFPQTTGAAQACGVDGTLFEVRA